MMRKFIIALAVVLALTGTAFAASQGPAPRLTRSDAASYIDTALKRNFHKDYTFRYKGGPLPRWRHVIQACKRLTTSSIRCSVWWDGAGRNTGSAFQGSVKIWISWDKAGKYWRWDYSYVIRQFACPDGPCFTIKTYIVKWAQGAPR
jgi:hypothetical protein